MKSDPKVHIVNQLLQTMNTVVYSRALGTCNLGLIALILLK